MENKNIWQRQTSNEAMRLWRKKIKENLLDHVKICQTYTQYI